MTELKPCPFCGGEAYINDQLTSIGSYTIQCVDCEAKIEDNRRYYTSADSTRHNCTKDWNTRQPHPAIQAVYDECKSLFVISEAVRAPNKPGNAVLYKLWDAVRKVVENE